ncbi:MAG TPA: carbohydrate ABC transporter permease [Anaerolineales bacterium]|nr:carbohydrate ABC transporter permease [Anaerolineales bacterium]
MNFTFVTAFASACLAIFLIPFLYMIFSSLKTHQQMAALGAPIWPAKSPTYQFTGQNTQTYDLQVVRDGKTSTITVNMNDYVGTAMTVYTVPMPDGTKKNLAMIQGINAYAIFLDPQNPTAKPYVYEGYYKSLAQPWIFSPTWSNYAHVWNLQAPGQNGTFQLFPTAFWNTFFYAFSTTVGVLLSCTLVAYGFSRFRFPGRDFWFVVLISTIFLPGAVTIIPTFTFFYKIGWVGTWLPLIVPSFFANAYDTFLLRQFFMTLPRELDEAAMIDGAGPFRVLWSVILPQSYAALVAVTIFHVVWAWNDYFNPLLYLSTKQQAQPISVALARFNYMYGSDPQYIQAGALMTLALPLIIFVLAQRFFVQGIVITGVEK